MTANYLYVDKKSANATDLVCIVEFNKERIDMGLFICSKCNCVENTALGWYWSRNNLRLVLPEDMKQYEKGMPLCSECLPESARFTDGSSPHLVLKGGKWHGKFPKQHIDDFMKSDEGKYYKRIGDYGLQYTNNQ